MSKVQRKTKRSPAELKSGGFIPQRQRGLVTVRCRAPGGRLTSARLRKIADVAEKYGKGIVHLSVRMSPEILYVKLADLEKVVRELEAAGQMIASCGRRVRVPTACGGCEYNPNGWTDTQRLAEQACDRYFGQPTPHKFKLAFSGCAIDCPRTREMDLGFQGAVEPEHDPSVCISCKLCVKACDDDALHLDEKEQYPVREPDKCTACGACIRVCPSGAMKEARLGHQVYVGGKHGKHPHVAYPLAELIPERKVFPVIEAVLAWYREQGNMGERIGDAIDRVGIDSLRRALQSSIGEDLLEAEDLRKPKWRRIFWRGAADAFPSYGAL